MDLPKSHVEGVVKQVKHVYSKLEVDQNQFLQFHHVDLYTQAHYSHQVVDPARRRD